MAKEFFKDLPNTTTPLTASRLNGLLDGEEPMGNLVVDSIRSKNLADTDNYLLGHINISTGTIEPNSDWAYSKVNVEVSTQYTYQITSTSSQEYEIAFYDSSNTFQHCDYGNFGAGTNLITITTYSDTAYVLIAWRNDLNHSNIQLEKGSSATTYTPYQGLDTSISFKTNVLTPNTTYTYSADLDVVYIKINKYVLLHIRNIGFNQFIQGNGIVLGSGLPKPKEYTVSYLHYNLNSDSTYEQPRVAINFNGELVVHWGTMAHYGESANKNYSGFVFYETTD
jgi:hypothetical protein